MSPTPEQLATLAQTRARMQEFTRLSAGDREQLAARQSKATTARREHKAAMKARKADRHALEMSTGPIWLVPVDQVPAPRKRAGKPIPYALTNRR